MTEVTTDVKDIGRQMWELLERKPQKYDVVFSVGDKKVKVHAVKFILEAASSVFEAEFEEKWESAVTKDGEGIPLVDLDPVAFQLFVKLVTLDTWSVEVLKALDLNSTTLLGLLGICRRFQITKAIKNLEDAAAKFIGKEVVKTSVRDEKTVEGDRDIGSGSGSVFNYRRSSTLHSQQKQKGEGSAPPSKKIIQRIIPWQCPHCTYINFIDGNFCEMCVKSRDFVEEVNKDKFPGKEKKSKKEIESSAAVPVPENKIECPHCTLLNPKHRVVCDCCQNRLKPIQD